MWATFLKHELFTVLYAHTLKTDIAHVSQTTAPNHIVKMTAYSSHVGADALY